MELILGTAEFNKEGYGGKPPIDPKEILRILNLAWEGGIRTLDTSDTYNTEHVEHLFSGFDRIFKSRTPKQDYFYHYKPLEPRIEGITHASVYEVEQLYGLYTAIIPFNINNISFLTYIKNMNTQPHKYLRSIFDNGRLLKDYTVSDCLSFVARQYGNGVIVGVNSMKELEEILKHWGYLRHVNAIE